MEKTKVSELLGRRIRALRKSQKLTQEELASRGSINYKYLGAIERGEENPSLSILEKIADGLGIEIEELFRFQHEETNPAKIKKILLDTIDGLEQEEVQKLQLILKILSALK